MNILSIFLAKYLFILSAVVLVVYFFTHRWPEQKRMALFAIPAGVLTYVLGLIASYLYYDPRPFVVDHITPLIQHAADNGFPSDHTLLAASFAAVGMYWNKWLGIALWTMAIIIAIARVYVGVHHSIDVLGSMGIALVAVSLWYAVAKYVWRA